MSRFAQPGTRLNTATMELYPHTCHSDRSRSESDSAEEEPAVPLQREEADSSAARLRSGVRNDQDAGDKNLGPIVGARKRARFTFRAQPIPIVLRRKKINRRKVRPQLAKSARPKQSRRESPESQALESSAAAAYSRARGNTQKPSEPKKPSA
jgi:hypothetical protein